MARVSATRSSSVMPRKKIAMAKAAAWPSVTAPLVRPAMKSPISPALNASPSRLARMISWGRIIVDLRASTPSTMLRMVPLPAAKARRETGVLPDALSRQGRNESDEGRRWLILPRKAGEGTTRRVVEGAATREKVMRALAHIGG